MVYHILSLILICSAFQANCESVCSIPVLKNGLQKLSAALSSSNHEIIFVSFDLKDCDLHPNLPVYGLLNLNINNTVPFQILSPKYRQPFNTVIKNAQGNIDALMQFGMRVSTLFVAISNSDLKLKFRILYTVKFYLLSLMNLISQIILSSDKQKFEISHNPKYPIIRNFP